MDPIRIKYQRQLVISGLSQDLKCQTWGFLS